MKISQIYSVVAGVVVGITLGTNTFAQVSLLDNGMSPAARYNAGQRMTGAYDVNQSFYCSQAAAKSTGFYSSHKTFAADGKIRTIGQMTQQAVDGFNDAFRLFALTQDPVVKGHHICVGFYFEKEAGAMGNAEATLEGYIKFDPRLLSYIYSLPTNLRNQLSEKFIYFHEFAHQLQFWNHDPITFAALEGRIPTVRPVELAADCVASAMLWRDVRGNTWSDAKNQNAILNAAEAVGDFEVLNSSHHGKPLERRQAVQAGFRVASQALFAQTSAFLIQACNAEVQNIR